MLFVSQNNKGVAAPKQQSRLLPCSIDDNVVKAVPIITQTGKTFTVKALMIDAASCFFFARRSAPTAGKSTEAISDEAAIGSFPCDVVAAFLFLSCDCF